MPESLSPIEALIQSEHVTPPTRAVLESRLAQPRRTRPEVFTPAQFAALQAACARLILQTGTDVDLAGLLDARLASGTSKGWRYEELPAGNAPFTLGMDGLDELAQARHGVPFHQLEAQAQDAVLHDVQAGQATGGVWESLPAARFFEELLAALSELYYSHPAVKAAIGDASFADATGWRHVGLNEKDGWELNPGA